MVSIIPINDWIEHEENTTCICGPRLEIVNGEMLVIHNSADGRETKENDNSRRTNPARPRLFIKEQ